MSDTIQITTTVRITDEDCDGIIDTAGYGGIGYWATSPTPEQWAEAEAQGKQYVIVEQDPQEGDGVFYLSRDDVRQAFAKIAATDQNITGPLIFGYLQSAIRDGENGGIDLGHIDADAADCLVQIACFGELVYG